MAPKSSHAARTLSTRRARGTVRRVLELPFAGRELAQSYLLGDLYLDGAIPEDELSIFLARNGFAAAFPMAGHRFRLMATDPDHHSKDETAPTLGELQRVYDRVSPIPARLRDLVWSSRFRINSRHLTTLRVGSVFLGGDAAHIHSPAGGQGMNTGIQDMVNLCWKLALVLKGRGKPELLDTYEAERLPIITQLVHTTERATRVFNSTNWMVHQLLSRTAPFALAFDQVQANAAAAVGEVAASYRTGPLAAPPTRVGELRSGDRVPDLELTTGTGSHPVRLHQLLDLSGLTLLSTAADLPATVVERDPALGRSHHNPLGLRRLGRGGCTWSGRPDHGQPERRSGLAAAAARWASRRVRARQPPRAVDPLADQVVPAVGIRPPGRSRNQARKA